MMYFSSFIVRHQNCGWAVVLESPHDIESTANLKRDCAVCFTFSNALPAPTFRQQTKHVNQANQISSNFARCRATRREARPGRCQQNF